MLESARSVLTRCQNDIENVRRIWLLFSHPPLIPSIATGHGKETYIEEDIFGGLELDRVLLSIRAG